MRIALQSGSGRAAVVAAACACVLVGGWDAAATGGWAPSIPSLASATEALAALGLGVVGIVLAACLAPRRSAGLAIALLASLGALPLQHVATGSTPVAAGTGLLLALGLAGTPAGRRVAQLLLRALHSRPGSRLTAALLVALAGAVWVSRVDQPALSGWHAALALAGLVGAWRWWHWHSPSRRRTVRPQAPSTVSTPSRR